MVKKENGKGNYMFPDTMKCGNIVFHYTRSVNQSFVNKVKEDIELVKKKIVSIKGVRLSTIDNDEPIHIYIYRDVSSFRKALGVACQKIETAQMHHIKSKSLETNYIIQDEEGNIHMVLPVGRSADVMDNFSAEIVAKVYTSYIALNEAKQNEFKSIVRKYVKANSKSKEETIENEEDISDEIDEDDEKKEDELQDEIDEEELEDIENTAEGLEKIEQVREVPEWLVVGFKDYTNSRLNNSKLKEKFSNYLKEKKITSPTKLAKSTLSESENFDRELACATVEYIIVRYGSRAYLKFCMDPTNYQVFGNTMTKYKFNQEIKEYIKQNYIIEDEPLKVKAQYVYFLTDDDPVVVDIDKEKQIE